MKDTIISMYITLIPLILTGILNMVFCKMSICKGLVKPLDMHKNFIDGKRIFGDNKTYKGLVGYIVIGILTNVIWGLISLNYDFLTEHNYLYVNYDNIILYNAVIGLLIGLAYALFELPNSFIKRRLDIQPGKYSTRGIIVKVFFILLDQCDSILGCVLVVWMVYPLGIKKYVLYIILGLVTHMIVNVFLYIAKLRKNIF